MRWWLILICVALAADHANAGELATDDKRGITMQVPDGYKTFPAAMAAPRTLFSYSKGEPGEPGFELLGVTTLGGTIGRESFDPTPIARQLAATLGLTIDRVSRRPMTWKGFTLDGFVATMRQGEQVVTLGAVQVPVRADAVQVMIMRLGDKDVGDELQSVLAGFQADSNWLTDDERIGKLVTGGLSLLATIGLVTFFVIRRRRARAS